MRNVKNARDERLYIIIIMIEVMLIIMQHFASYL